MAKELARELFSFYLSEAVLSSLSQFFIFCSNRLSKRSSIFFFSLLRKSQATILLLEYCTRRQHNALDRSASC